MFEKSVRPPIRPQPNPRQAAAYLINQAFIGSDRALQNNTGLAIVAAATTPGSVISLAAPWWKRLLSAPHAASAAFIEGAAIA
jgi:hypothetical protein